MLKAGQAAPDVRLQDRSGTGVSIAAEADAGRVLLAFFKVSCPTCQLTLPYLERLTNSGGLRVAGISQDDARATGEFAARFGLTFPLWLDDAGAGYPASNAYGITHVPSLFLVGPGGKIGWTSHGFSRAEMEELGRMAGVAIFTPEDRVPEWKPG